MKLVFVHGAGESSLSFYYQTRHFRNSEGIDLPGHPDGKPCTSVEGYVEWVRGFVAARRYSDVVLCGHSMGGAIAQLYALKYPEELRGVILVGTGARLRVHPRYLKDCEDGSEDTAQWLENRKAEYSRIEPDLQQALIQRSEEVGPAVKLNDLLCCDKFDIMDRVGEIAVPAQVVCGTEDVMTPVKYSDYLANKIPGSRKSILDGATHYVQMERHREVNETIEEFLASLG
jgi:pimeloyl-ACP methyl ester carboxylesterase